MERTCTTWTCRRCGGTQQCPDRGQPSDWVRITRSMPPRRADGLGWGDYCGRCWGVIQSVMAGESPSEEAPSFGAATTGTVTGEHHYQVTLTANEPPEGWGPSGAWDARELDQWFDKLIRNSRPVGVTAHIFRVQ